VSKQWETFQVGRSIRLRRIGGKRTKAATAPVVDESLTKAELVAEAEERGVDASGTKAEIVERLNA
jgi:hypothetical protein